MTKNRWRAKIVQCCEEAGTYKPYFADIVDTLADILHKRDQAQAAFKRSGDEMFIHHTNKSGAQNLELHPALKTVNDLNRDALQYWRDLGLTPSALRRMNESAFKPKETSGFSLALAEALNGAGA